MSDEQLEVLPPVVLRRAGDQCSACGSWPQPRPPLEVEAPRAQQAEPLVEMLQTELRGKLEHGAEEYL